MTTLIRIWLALLAFLPALSSAVNRDYDGDWSLSIWCDNGLTGRPGPPLRVDVRIDQGTFALTRREPRWITNYSGEVQPAKIRIEGQTQLTDFVGAGILGPPTTSRLEGSLQDRNRVALNGVQYLDRGQPERCRGELIRRVRDATSSPRLSPEGSISREPSQTVSTVMDAKPDAPGAQALPTPTATTLSAGAPTRPQSLPTLEKPRPAESSGSVAQALAAPTTTASVARRALVIGNDSYRNVARLRTAKADAQAIERTLAGLGYTVTAHYDLLQREMNKAIRDFVRKLSGGDEVILFYAGHGVQIGGANYLLPVDIGAEDAAAVRDEAIALQRVLDDFADARARFTLAIIDACRDNPFVGTSSGRMIAARGLAPTNAASGQMIMFSAGTGQQALDRVGPNDMSPNGLFTRVLLRYMLQKETPVDRLLRQVRAEVVEIAKSVGHEQVPALYDQAIGEFYFVR